MRKGIEIRRGRQTGSSGVELAWTVLLSSPEIRPQLLMDQRFILEQGVYGGRLLDVAGTKALWGSRPGRFPEDWLTQQAPGTIGFCPTNWGWQRGAWLFAEQRWQGVRQDPLPSEPLWMLGWSPERGWHESSIELERPLPESMVGLEMPQILRDQQSVPLGSLLGHARLLSDLRNVFDFADGRGPELDPEFWIGLRRILPSTYSEARVLLAGGEVSCPVDKSAEGMTKLLDKIDQLDLDGVRVVGGSVVFGGRLRLSRLPLFGIGARSDGTLVVVALDGRQTDLPGATIEEAAVLLRDHGACTGGLGSAGGDVCLVERTETGMHYLNHPSTLDAATGRGISRPVPSLMLL